jgi:hypothetical protein
VPAGREWIRRRRERRHRRRHRPDGAVPVNRSIPVGSGASIGTVGWFHCRS